MKYRVGYEFKGQSYTTDVNIATNATPKKMIIRGNTLVIKLSNRTERKILLDSKTGEPIRALKNKPAKVRR